MATARRGLKLETLEPRWDLIIVAAPGPSLTAGVAERCRSYPTIAIKQAALPGRMPWASVVYACNAFMWEQWGGFSKFDGERWSCHHHLDRKDWIADRYGLRVVRGDGIGALRFSDDRSVVHYGLCSGFASLGFAVHWLKRPGRIVMVGFDFRNEGGPLYWNGNRPNGPGGGQFHVYRRSFEEASQHLPEGVEIVNATPGSALKCFPMMTLESALA